MFQLSWRIRVEWILDSVLVYALSKITDHVEKVALIALSKTHSGLVDVGLMCDTAMLDSPGRAQTLCARRQCCISEIGRSARFCTTLPSWLSSLFKLVEPCRQWTAALQSPFLD